MEQQHYFCYQQLSIFIETFKPLKRASLALFEIPITAFENSVCPVCGCGDSVTRFPIVYRDNSPLDMLGIPKPYPQVFVEKCSHCAHHYATPQLRSDLIDEYYSVASSAFYSSERLEGADRFQNRHRSIVQIVEQKKTCGNILEIGCGTGGLLACFDKEKWNCHGVEPSPQASKIANSRKNISVFNGFLDEQTFETKFDVILLIDVVEHLKTPSELFKLLNKYLMAEGIVVVATGDINSFTSRFAGRWWSYFGSWEHLSFFSSKSMETFLSKHGLDVLEIKKASHRGTYFENLITQMLWNPIAKAFNMFPFLMRFVSWRAKSQNIYHGGGFDHMIAVATPNMQERTRD